jgi:hypothetical protein
MPLPRSTIPVGPSGLTLSTCTVLSPLFRRRRHPRCLFRNSITRLRHPLSTLQVVRYRTRMQDSLPAGGWPLPGGCRTLWIPTKSFYHLHLISSFSGFILARRNVSQVDSAAIGSLGDLPADCRHLHTVCRWSGGWLTRLVVVRNRLGRGDSRRHDQDVGRTVAPSVALHRAVLDHWLDRCNRRQAIVGRLVRPSI